MRLSQYFTLAEMVKSQTASRLGIKNEPNDEQINSMKILLLAVLDPVRRHFRKPIIPSSGYRSPALCEAIGSSTRSQHAKGEAVDFEVAGVPNLEVAEWIRDNLVFDQLILECYEGGNTGWIHVSYNSDRCRSECLTYTKKDGYTKGLKE
jgi:hypothetical protein